MVSLENNKLFLILIQNNDLKKCKYLIKIGINVNIKNNHGYTALIYASWHGYKEICLWLIENKANVNIQNIYGETALMSASIKGNKEICLLLLENKADVNTKDKNGWTALICAARYKNKEICLILMENGANMEEKNEYGYTVLMIACRLDHKQIILLLIRSGCNYSSNYERMSCNRLSIPTFRTFMIEYIKNQKYIKLKDLVGVAPEEILDDINNKSISYCTKCSTHFYYCRYELKLKNINSSEIINVKIHCL